jgi:PAS domain S-box-containing protein
MSNDLREMHRLLTLLQAIDVGLLVVDREYRVTLWNSFMENHSGRTADHVLGRSLFDLPLAVPHPWLKRKLDATFTLQTRSHLSWQQRPYLFRFESYRPITGISAYMYQDVSLLPLDGLDGSVDQVGLVLHDVTDTAEAQLKHEAVHGSR